MNPPMVTLLFAAVFALMLLVLSLRVVLRRREMRIGIGDGGDKLLARQMRVHGNFVEHVPFALLLLGLLEACGLERGWVWGFGGTLLLARILHVVGLSRSAGYSAGRFSGVLLTWLALLGMAIAGFWLYLH